MGQKKFPYTYAWRPSLGYVRTVSLVPPFIMAASAFNPHTKLIPSAL